MARRNSTAASPLEGAYSASYNGPEVCVACEHHECDNSENVCKLNPPPQPVVDADSVCSKFTPTQTAIVAYGAVCKELDAEYETKARVETINRLQKEPPME